MLCKWCNKQLEDWQIKEGNTFCGKSCSGKYSASKRYLLSDSERFWSKVDKSGSCWVWTGRTDKCGYGKISIKGKNTGAHRFSYELHFGSILKDKIICHHCDNPSCVNPNHLYLGDHKTNANDRETRGKGSRGINNPNVSITPEKVREIRNMYRESHKISELAKILNTTRNCVAGVVYNKTWKHIK